MLTPSNPTLTSPTTSDRTTLAAVLQADGRAKAGGIVGGGLAHAAAARGIVDVERLVEGAVGFNVVPVYGCAAGLAGWI